MCAAREERGPRNLRKTANFFDDSNPEHSVSSSSAKEPNRGMRTHSGQNTMKDWGNSSEMSMSGKSKQGSEKVTEIACVGQNSISGMEMLGITGSGARSPDPTFPSHGQRVPEQNQLRNFGDKGALSGMREEVFEFQNPSLKLRDDISGNKSNPVEGDTLMRDSEQFREENKCNKQKVFQYRTFFLQQQPRRSRVEEGKSGERELPCGEKAPFREIIMEEADHQDSTKGDSATGQIAENPEANRNGGGITGLDPEDSPKTESFQNPLPSIVYGREGEPKGKTPNKGSSSGGLTGEGNITEANFSDDASRVQVEEAREKVKDLQVISGRKEQNPDTNLSSLSRCNGELEENRNVSLRKRKLWARKIRANRETVPDFASAPRNV
ncbi:hypothetical protein U1Q18_041783 [Sarracenia purpurea var. burkii]